MTRPVAVLRPEPGNAATAARIEAMGLDAIRLPLFAARTLDWTAPDPAGFDALILTSSATPRLAGAGLSRYAALPVHAVGRATADAARAAGLNVVATGRAGATSLLAAAREAGVRGALFLGGYHHALEPGGIVRQAIAVYRMDALAADVAPVADSVALLHSARAAARLSELVADRATVRIAAISAAVATAAGPGWAAVAVADRPEEAALLAVARNLAD